MTVLNSFVCTHRIALGTIENRRMNNMKKVIRIMLSWLQKLTAYFKCNNESLKGTD